jgi:(2Fe-2S) ferredoxin
MSAMASACQPAVERPGPAVPVTKRTAIAQVACCVGCCCGRTDRGFPAVPVERLKAGWKEEKLNRTVQLTISGCLGPCDMANVILVMTAAGTEWFGGIDDEAVFDAVIAWARACQAKEALLPLPAVLDTYRFKRFMEVA